MYNQGITFRPKGESRCRTLLEVTTRMIAGYEDRVELKLNSIPNKKSMIIAFHPAAYKEIFERAKAASDNDEIELIFREV